MPQQLGGSLDPVHPLQPDIHQDDIGRRLLAKLHGIGAIFGLAHYAEFRAPLQNRADSVAHQLVIIDKNHVERHSFSQTTAACLARIVVPAPGWLRMDNSSQAWE